MRFMYTVKFDDPGSEGSSDFNEFVLAILCTERHIQHNALMALCLQFIKLKGPRPKWISSFRKEGSMVADLL